MDDKKLKIGWFSFSCCEDSITGNSTLYARVNGVPFYGTIEELEQKIKPTSIRHIRSKCLIRPKNKLEVLSVEGNSKKDSRVMWKEVRYLIKHFVRKPIFTVLLRTGKYVNITGDHSLFKRIITNKYLGNYQGTPIEKIVPCKVSELEKKDAVWCIDDYGFDLKDYRIDDFLLVLAGLWLADGCYDYQHGLHISTGNDQNILDFLREIGKKYEFNLTIRKNGDTTLNSRGFMRRFITELGLEGYSDTKKLPSWCYLLSNRQIRLLLRGYFSGDGTVEKDRISCSSVSIGLIEGLKELLNRLGIISSVSITKKRNVAFGSKKYIGRSIYRLSVAKLDSLNRFLEIGFIQDYKNNKLKRYKKFRNKFYGLSAHKIKNVEVSDAKEYVYDFDVPETQNFVANGILCHNSTIVFTELLNDHFDEWSKLIDFQHVRVLKSKNKLEGLDVAFVEGAIASESDSKKLKKIRKNSKKLVAIGSCACNGLPSAQRNDFDKERLNEIAFLIKRFKLSKKVLRVEEVVKVDYKVPGCPMSEQMFLKTLDNLLQEFKMK